MASQQNLDIVYMKMAYNAAELSRAVRRKVGAILVTPNEGRFEGVNGMPSGFDNCCETQDSDGILHTKPEVLHAESNAIMKVARSHASSIGGTLYCTLAPCIECAKLIIQAGIVRVVYSEHYPYPGHTGVVRTVGLDLLKRAGIVVDMLPMQGQNDNDRELFPRDDGHHDINSDQWTGFRP